MTAFTNNLKTVVLLGVLTGLLVGIGGLLGKQFIIPFAIFAVLMNFGLAIFNLIPAPPLDGGTVLAGLLPERLMPAYRQFAQYGFFIILGGCLLAGRDISGFIGDVTKRLVGS